MKGTKYSETLINIGKDTTVFRELKYSKTSFYG